MKTAALIVLGVLIAIAGAVWALQGFGYIGGSFMSGNSVWSVIGPVTVLIGIALAVTGLLRLRHSRRPG